MNKKISMDPRAKRTKAYFINALITLLNKKDLNKITVQNIADEAKLTRGTFYLHYIDKQDFYSSVINDVLEELIVHVKDNAVSQIIEKKDKIYAHPSFIKLFEYIYDHREFFKVMLSDKGIPEFRRRLQNIVEEKIYEELVDNIVDLNQYNNIPKEILFSYITSAHIGVITSWLDNDVKYSPEFMAHLLYNWTLKGVINEVTRERENY
jgi:AcrR family transcriptional regulator